MITKEKLNEITQYLMEHIFRNGAGVNEDFFNPDSEWKG